MIFAVLGYILYLIIFGLINIAVVYHVWRYSYPNDASRPALGVYLIIIGIIIVSTFILVGVI